LFKSDGMTEKKTSDSLEKSVGMFDYIYIYIYNRYIYIYISAGPLVGHTAEKVICRLQ